ncbi:MAG: NAD(+) diphosphatase [Rhizobiaceae bacterium]
MTRPFLDPNYHPEETSARLAYSGGRLDRLSEIRAESCIADALASPQTQVMGFAKGRVLISFADEAPKGVFGVDELAAFEPQLDRALLMGSANGGDMLAVPLGIDPEGEDFNLPEPFKAIDYRSLARQGLLPHDELGNVAYGGAMLAWHATNGFCARCGGKSEMRAGGAKRVCTSCEKEHFPRTDPVVIMLTVHGDKCLLGRSHHFLPGMYSALAGFVEPGETMESAVRRETFEESGIRVGKVTYHATQPWPFPHTLMIGCYGEALETEITKDDLELEDCRWFSRTEVREILAETGPQNEDGSPKFVMPAQMAIANCLISDWAAQD